MTAIKMIFMINLLKNGISGISCLKTMILSPTDYMPEMLRPCLYLYTCFAVSIVVYHIVNR